MSKSYKSRKEDFVSNLTGGEISEINYVTLVAPVCLSLTLSNYGFKADNHECIIRLPYSSGQRFNRASHSSSRKELLP